MDGRTDGDRQGQMDERDFIGRCPTNVKRPKQDFEEKLSENIAKPKKLW